MQSSLSLRQGQRLGVRNNELAQNVSFGYPRPLPRSLDYPPALRTQRAEQQSGAESTYDWLARQYQNFFGTTPASERRAQPHTREGMTSAYAFDGVKPGVDAANKRMEANMQNTLQTEGASIAQYVNADEELSAGANLYVNTTESSMNYRNTFVRAGDEVAYITDRGALKSVGAYDGAVYKSIVGQRGCPGKVDNKTVVSDQDNGDGTVGSGPFFFKGTPMSLNEPCGRAGVNSQVMGASLAENNARAWEGGCMEGINDQFLAQEDIVGKTAKTALSQCHARAADVGASSFYVRKNNKHEFPCFISRPSKTFDSIVAGGTAATVEVQSGPWIAENSVSEGEGDNVAAGILNDGRIVIGSLGDSNEKGFASAVNMLSTQDTMLMTEARGVKQEGCDPVKGASISVQSATFGNNCGGMAEASTFEPFSEEPIRELPPTPPLSPLPAPPPPAPEPAPEPDPMEYWQVPKGGGACPAVNAIPTMDGCKAAADARGLVFGGEAGAHPDHVDCFQALDGREVKSVTWAKTSATDRATPGGYFKSHYSALCQKPAGGGGKQCVPGQGATGAYFKQTNAPSFAECSVSCGNESSCRGFDFTTTSNSDACRLYGDNTPRTDAGADSRQYCTKSGGDWNQAQIQQICTAKNPDWTVQATPVACAADACNTKLGGKGWMDLCNAGAEGWSCCAKDFNPKAMGA